MNCDVPALWNVYKQRLYAYIQKRVADEDDVKDIHQEVLIKVYKFCQSKSGVRKIDSWLYQIAHNTIADYYNKKNKHSTIDSYEKYASENLTEPYIEAADYILPLIELLPKKYGEPLLLSDIHYIKQQEIADRLGLTLSSTKSRIQRARSLLKKEFQTCFNLQQGITGEIMNLNLKMDCKPLQEGNREDNKKNI